MSRIAGANGRSDIIRPGAARDEGLGMLVNEGEEGEDPDPWAGLEDDSEEEKSNVTSLAAKRARSKLHVVK